MRRDELLEALQARPFRPIRLYVSDGGTFDIRHPEMLMVGRGDAIVDLEGNGGRPARQGYPDIGGHTVLDLLHITRYEQIPQPERRTEGSD
jgi:hypothetical protein